MKYTYLSILTFMIILILVFFIILTVINNNNKTIETFTTSSSSINYPIINYANIRTIPLSKSSSFYGIYVAKAEQFEESSKNDDIIYAFSSFNIADNDKLLSVLNNSNISASPITLTPSTNEGLDYIYYDLPEDTNEKYLLSNVTIIHDMSGDSRVLNSTELNYYKNLFDITTVNFLNSNPFSKSQKLVTTINSVQTENNTKLHVQYGFGFNDYPLLYSNLALVTKTKLASTTTLKINSITLKFVDKIDGYYFDNSQESDTVNMISNNANEAIILPFLSNIADCNKDDKILAYKYYKILKLKIPWAIYDPVLTNSGSESRIKDALGRGVRDGVITGTGYSTKKDDNNVNYLDGTIETTITFPPGSFMIPNFTCCSITKYNGIHNNNRKLVLSDDANLGIGHYNGIERIIQSSAQNGKKWPNNPSQPNTKEKTNWVVTCFKGTANNEETIKNKSIIINDNKITTSNNFINDYQRSQKALPEGTTNCGSFDTLPMTMQTRYETDIISDTCLTNINKFNTINLSIYGYNLGINHIYNSRDLYSDFGFAYMLVWDCILTDNELLIISKVLNNYVNNPISTIPSIKVDIPLFDGSTKERAANSALEIKRLTGTNTNGLYWIKPDATSEAVQIFCIMDSNCNGGGWMLAIEGKINSVVFTYDSEYWTGTNTLARGNNTYFEGTSRYMDTSQDAKYVIYNTYPVKDCLAIFDSREFPGILEQRQKYTNPNFPEYGWRWYERGFNYNSPITLKDFFLGNKRIFKYTYNGAVDSKTISNIFTKMNGFGTYLNYLDFMDRYINNNGPYNKKIFSNQSAYLSYGFNNYVVSQTPKYRVRWGGIFNENTEPYSYHEVKGKPIYKTKNKKETYTYNTGRGFYMQTKTGTRYITVYDLDSNGNKQIIGYEQPSKWVGNTEYPYLPDSVDVSGGIGLYNKSAGDIVENVAGNHHRDLGVNKSLSFKWFIR